MDTERTDERSEQSRSQPSTRAGRGESERQATRADGGRVRDHREHGEHTDRSDGRSDTGQSGQTPSSSPTDIRVVAASRLPDIDDYDPVTHEYDDAYVHQSEYPLHVSACGGVTGFVPDDLPDVTEEIRREFPWSGPGPGGRRRRRRERPIGKNASGRQVVDDDIVAWHWRLEDDDGEVVDRAERRAALGPEACGTTLTAPGTGTYHVHLRLELVDGEETASESITIRDRLVVSIGDSYASGQGVPDEPARIDPWAKSADLCDSFDIVLRGTGVPTAEDAVWVEPGAWRSFEAAPYRAAEAVEDRSDGDLVTFLSFASSGATVSALWDDSQRDWQEGPQIEEVDDAVGDRTIDALLVSVGGNDAGFSDGLRELVRSFDRFERLKVDEQASEAIRELRDSYDELDTALEELEPNEVLVTEYPVAHFDVDDSGSVGKGCGVFDMGPLEVDEMEARVVKQIGKRLNEAVAEAAERAEWTYVDGVAEAFRGHGICRDRADRYFVTSSESCKRQGDFKGTMHPNAAGQRAYAEQIAPALERALETASRSDDSDADAGEERDQSDDSSSGEDSDDGGTGDWSGGGGSAGGGSAGGGGGFDPGGHRPGGGRRRK